MRFWLDRFLKKTGYPGPMVPISIFSALWNQDFHKSHPDHINLTLRILILMQGADLGLLLTVSDLVFQPHIERFTFLFILFNIVSGFVSSWSKSKKHVSGLKKRSQPHLHVERLL